MAISALAPLGGIVAELGGVSRPLILRNGEIERFEVQHNLGIFAMVSQLLGRSEPPQARHCRDLVALALVGGGMGDRAADQLVSDLPPHENARIRAIAQDVVFAAFAPPELAKKKDSVKAGSSESTPPADTTAQENSAAP
jgi:hypothetical protein